MYVCDLIDYITFSDIPVCPDGLPMTGQNWNSPSAFDDLSIHEMAAVEQYMRSIKSLGIKKISEATPNSTFIMLMERLPARKSDVLGHIENKRNAPKRFARVVLVRGDISTPVIEEFKVGVLPRPSHHDFLRYPKYK